MKTSIIYLIVISFLFQSSYTHRTMDLKDTALLVGKNYKIGQDAKFVKSKLEPIKNSVLTAAEDYAVKEIKNPTISWSLNSHHSST